VPTFRQPLPGAQASPGPRIANRLRPLFLELRASVTGSWLNIVRFRGLGGPGGASKRMSHAVGLLSLFVVRRVNIVMQPGGICSTRRRRGASKPSKEGWGRSPPPLWMVLKPPGTAQTPKTAKFQPRSDYRCPKFQEERQLWESSLSGSKLGASRAWCGHCVRFVPRQIVHWTKHLWKRQPSKNLERKWDGCKMQIRIKG